MPRDSIKNRCGFGSWLAIAFLVAFFYSVVYAYVYLWPVSLSLVLQ
jgi:hypothetical protein